MALDGTAADGNFEFVTGAGVFISSVGVRHRDGKRYEKPDSY